MENLLSLHNLFIGLTFLIGLVGIGGACAAVAAVVFLGPTAFVTVIEPVLARFLGCAWCVAIVVFVNATVFAYWVGRHGEYERGYAAAIAAIAAEDETAIAGATEKRKVWQDCRDRNGQWDQSTGECR